MQVLREKIKSRLSGLSKPNLASAYRHGWVGIYSLLVADGNLIYYGVFQYVLSFAVCVVAPRGACEVAHTCNPQELDQGVCKSDKPLEAC